MKDEKCKLLTTPQELEEGERKLALARKKRKLEKLARKFTSRSKANILVSKIYNKE